MQRSNSEIPANPIRTFEPQTESSRAAPVGGSKEVPDLRSQIKLGRIFGIEIGLHYSWFLIALLIVFSLSSQFHTSNPQWGDGLILSLAVATAILFFVSLLVHELAHSIVASSNGLPVKEITLFALGGVSQIEKNPTSATLEFWMAFVGSLTSAAIGGICLLMARALGGASSNPWMAMLLWLGYINLTLAAFNLIPGYPLDGGRVLRAIIWWKTGDADRSTRAAAKTGQAVALAFIAFGIFQFFGGAGVGGLWIAFIGWFLLQAARETYVQVGLAHALEGVRVADVMTRDCPIAGEKPHSVYNGVGVVKNVFKHTPTFASRKRRQGRSDRLGVDRTQELLD
jgi:Zn-dependent protease